VYAHRSFSLHLPERLRRCRNRIAQLSASPDHDAIVELFVDVGEAYAAVADGSAPGDAVVDAWAAAMQTVAAALCESWHGRPVSITLPSMPAGSPVDVRATTAEGFAYYALLPEQYLVAAERFVRERAPASLLCIGIRSIGGPLAFVVAAAARALGVAARVVTVRPCGHPFDRRVEFTEPVPEQLIAVVDEGPGLSGSSFASVADALVGRGVAPDRITLFPSWEAPVEGLRSARGRAAWRRHPHAVAAFEDVWPIDGLTDISAGQWRALVFGPDDARWPAVQPQHERRKYLPSALAPATVMRFAGLGRYGREKFERAALLGDAGFAPRAASLRRGFLSETWVDGRRLDAADGRREEVLDRVAAYAAFLRRDCRTGNGARTEDLDIAARFDEPEIAVDGRMMPHDWVERGSALVKTDALDHHADDFLPGCRDIAWDLAGASVEFDLDASAERRMIETYVRLSGDRTIGHRLPEYKTAYLRYRLAYVSLAIESLGGSTDAPRFSAAASRYRRSLAARESSRHRRRRC